MIKETAEQRLFRKYGVRFDDDEGRWVTTENGHHVHLNEEGNPDKGNPHVLAAAKGESKSPKTKPKNIGTKEDVQQLLDYHGISEKQFWDMVTANGGNAVKVLSNLHSMSPMKGGSSPAAPRSTGESKRALNNISDRNGWVGRIEDLEEELEDEGFSVEESNREYVVVSDNRNEQDTQFVLRLGGTERSITIDDIKVEKMPDSDDDYDDEDEEED